MTILFCLKRQNEQTNRQKCVYLIIIHRSFIISLVLLCQTKDTLRIFETRESTIGRDTEDEYTLYKIQSETVISYIIRGIFSCKSAVDP